MSPFYIDTLSKFNKLIEIQKKSVFEINTNNAVSYKLWTTADSAAKGSYNRRNCYSIRPVVNDAKK